MVFADIIKTNLIVDKCTTSECGLPNAHRNQSIAHRRRDRRPGIFSYITLQAAGVAFEASL